MINDECTNLVFKIRNSMAPYGCLTDILNKESFSLGDIFIKWWSDVKIHQNFPEDFIVAASQSLKENCNE